MKVSVKVNDRQGNYFGTEELIINDYHLLDYRLKEEVRNKLTIIPQHLNKIYPILVTIIEPGKSGNKAGVSLNIVPIINN